MKYLDLSWAKPQENLACDEALIDQCEELGGEEVLRFWESDEPFVVVGYSNRIEEEVNVDACRESGIPILRRCSGGGTVLQGPGCLNYSLVLQIAHSSEMESVSGTNAFVMNKHKNVFAKLLGEPVEVNGHTDLTVEGVKFSGNAQRRKRTFLLFHGTFLLNFDLTKTERVLRYPSRSPSYRKNRSHLEFLTNLSLPADFVKEALRGEWKAREVLASIPHGRVEKLVNEKYSVDSWIWRV